MKGMMEEIMNTKQAEMRSTVCAIRSELKETIRVMRAATEPIQAELDETTACHKATVNTLPRRRMTSHSNSTGW
jgi:hypothetical protein